MKRGEKIVGHVSIELSSRVLVIFETQSTLYWWGEKREARKWIEDATLCSKIMSYWRSTSLLQCQVLYVLEVLELH